MRFKLSLLALVSILGVGYGATVAAQPQSEPQAQSIDIRDDRDNGMDMGWLGLLGLTGLFGLKRSAEARHRTVSDGHSSVAR